MTRAQLTLVIPMPRGRARKATPKARVSYAPWPCTVLAVDTAGTSGWAVRTRGKLQWSGEVNTLDSQELDAVVGNALLVAHNHDVPIVLVLERPFAGGHPQITMALGMARERWFLAWERCGESRRKRVVSVMPASWRSPVLGGKSVRMRRDAVRALEAAAMTFEVAEPLRIGADEAAAILISKWAARAAKVGEALGLLKEGKRR